MANEKRLIDPDEFLQWLIKRFKCVPLIGSCDRDSESVKLLLSQAPTVDAVEVVRCRDFESYNGHRYCNFLAGAVLDDDFCSYGERRTDGKS